MTKKVIQTKNKPASSKYSPENENGLFMEKFNIKNHMDTVNNKYNR